jgi:2-oxoglutarate ferredoxin oxidoreductase subunit alpha
MQHKVIDVQDVVIRFSGDSGDGMQLTGTLFADASALLGNEISTFPDFPAEIRAPQGTVAGVSGFQVHVGNCAVHTPGDYCDVLVAMNPAALKCNAKWAKPTATIIVDIDTFDAKSIAKAGFLTSDPFEELDIKKMNVVYAPITSLTRESLKDSGQDPKVILRSKNMLALGICFFMYNMPLNYTEEYFLKKFKKNPLLVDINKKVLKDGFNYAGNIQAIADTYFIQPPKHKKGIYRNINGNQATAWGLMAASEKSGRPLFCGSYPITPATAILEELAAHKELGIKTLQCEMKLPVYVLPLEHPMPEVWPLPAHRVQDSRLSQKRLDWPLLPSCRLLSLMYNAQVPLPESPPRRNRQILTRPFTDGTENVPLPLLPLTHRPIVSMPPFMLPNTLWNI